MYCVATKWQQKNRIAYALPIIQIMKILSAKSHKQMCLRLVYRERALSVPARMYSRLRLFIESKIFRSNRPCFAPLCRYIYGRGYIYSAQDTLSDFIAHIKEFADCAAFAADILKNNQVLSGRNKAEVFYEIAAKLHEYLDIDTFEDFRHFAKEPLLELVLRSVKGMGDAGVNYMFMMAGDPNRCKPDVHIHRCIKNALGTDVPNNECQILFRETVKKLKDSGYPDLTVRNLDSVIWNKYQKNRSIF